MRVVATASETYEAGEVILAAGVWTPGLVGAPLQALAIQPQALHWFAAEQPELYCSDRFPVFIWMHGPALDDLFYGFPIPPGPAFQAVKVATESFISIASPDGFDRLVSEGLAAEAMWRQPRGRPPKGPAARRG